MGTPSVQLYCFNIIFIHSYICLSFACKESSLLIIIQIDIEQCRNSLKEVKSLLQLTEAERNYR